VKARGQAMRPPDDPTFDAGAMLAVQGALKAVEQELPAFQDVIIANQNSNSQVVLAGPTAEIRRAAEVLGAKGYKATLLPVSAAFHTPLVGHASEPFAAAVAHAEFQIPNAKVYSNTTGEPYPHEPDAARDLLAKHILNPVLFKRQIEGIYGAGGRVFIENRPEREPQQVERPPVARRLCAAASGGPSPGLRGPIRSQRVTQSAWLVCSSREIRAEEVCYGIQSSA